MRLKTALFFVTGVLIYFSLFHHLGTPPIRLWDESLFAMRAYFFANTGSYLPDFSYFPGISGYRNLKPPLGTWLQGFSFYCFGASELALRLPVVCFALLTMAVTTWFLKKMTGSYYPGWFFTLILLSCPGYVREHVVRTGDQDVLYVFFLLLQVIFFLSYLHEGKKKFLWALGGAVLAAFLIKSIMAFFLFPAFCIYLMIRRRWAVFFRQPVFYLVLALGLASVVGYYAIMESVMQGFFDMVLETVWGRYVTVRDQQQLPVFYYAVQFITRGYFPWVFLLLLGVGQTGKQVDPKVRDLLSLSWIALLTFLLIITFSRTKLQWYDAALYPIAAQITAVYLYGALFKQKSSKRLRYGIITAALASFSWGYIQVLRANDHPVWEHPSEQFGYMLRHLRAEHPELKSFLIYADEYNGQVGFYSQLLNDRHDYQIEVMNYWGQKDAPPGTVIMVCHADKLQRVQTETEFAVIGEHRNCVVGKVQ